MLATNRVRAALLGSAIVVGSTAAAGAQMSDVASTTTKLFSRLSGTWECVGGFPNGRALSAELSFTPVEDFRALSFEHVDRAPSTFWHRSTWAIDSKASRLFSVGFSGTTTQRAASAVLFESSEITDSSIVLEADTLKVPPFTPNRFAYVRSGARLTMRWEIKRGAAWMLGDSLVCEHR